MLVFSFITILIIFGIYKDCVCFKDLNSFCISKSPNLAVEQSMGKYMFINGTKKKKTLRIGTCIAKIERMMSSICKILSA